MRVRTGLSLLLSYKVSTRLYKSTGPSNLCFSASKCFTPCLGLSAQLKLSDTNSQAWTREGRERPSIKITGDERRLGMQAQQLSITGIQYMHTIDVKESADLQPFDSWQSLLLRHDANITAYVWSRIGCYPAITPVSSVTHPTEIIRICWAVTKLISGFWEAWNKGIENNNPDSLLS